MNDAERLELQELQRQNPEHLSNKQWKRLVNLRQRKEVAKARAFNIAKYGDKYVNSLNVSRMDKRVNDEM